MTVEALTPTDLPISARPICPCCGSELPNEPLVTGIDRVLSVPGEFKVFQCRQCGSGKTFPWVPEDEIATLYEGDYPNHADDQAGSGPLAWLIGAVKRFYEWRLRASMPLSGLPKQPGRLLDVGCGNGWVAEMVAADGWDVTGIEPTEAGCEQTARRGIKVHQGTINTVELEPAGFDAVLFFHVLEHTVDPATDLDRALKLLKPGGKLLIGVPNFGCWQREAFGPEWLMLELPRHRTHFTERGIAELMGARRARIDNVTKGTSLTTLPMSIQIKLFGNVRTNGQLFSRLFAAASIPLFPLTALYNRIRGGGEILNVVATKS